EAENPSAGRDADESDVALRPVPQHFGDATLHLAADIHAPRAAIDVPEREAGIGDGRVIEDRNEPRRIGHHGAVEQGLVAVQQTDEIDVAIEVIGFALEMAEHALNLSLEAVG